MTIDERLEALVERHEALTERHEALTQTVELIASLQKDNDAHITRLAATIAEDGKNIRALARIAEAHEHRLTDLEGGE